METLERPIHENLNLEVPVGPMVEETWLSNGLDLYKLTMSQFMSEREDLNDKQVTFTLKNRGKERLADYVNPAELKDRLDFIRERGWNEDEINYFRTIPDSNGQRRFTEDFLTYLQTSELPEVNVRVDEKTNDLAVDVTGDAPLVTFWETIVMSEVSEAYFANYIRANNIDVNDLYAEGDRRMDGKIGYLQTHDDVKLVEFGTRRRFSLRWQKHVTERLKNETNNLIGTSNVAFSGSEGLKPMGTFAHELPMIYAGLADALGMSIRDSQNRMFEDWSARYPDLTSILSDTFGSAFTFANTSAEQAQRWNGFRQDSGDELAYGETTIKLYQGFGIDPTTKNVMFTNALHMNLEDNTVEPIRARFSGRLGFTFGIGTNDTNDLGLKPLNIVAKATHVYDPVTKRGASTVKRSDDPDKAQGDPEKIALYEEEFNGKL